MHRTMMHERRQAIGVARVVSVSVPSLECTVSLVHTDTSSSEVAAGSCATDARESGQIRKEAAFIGRRSVPQIAWPSLQSTKSTTTKAVP